MIGLQDYQIAYGSSSIKELLIHVSFCSFCCRLAVIAWLGIEWKPIRLFII